MATVPTTRKLIETPQSLSNSTLRFRYQLGGHLKEIKAAVYNPLRHNFVTADDSNIILWSLRKEIKRATIGKLFDGHNLKDSETLYLEFVPSSDCYLLVTTDGYVRILSSSLRLLSAFDTLDERPSKIKQTPKPLACSYSHSLGELYISFNTGIVVAWHIVSGSSSLFSEEQDGLWIRLIQVQDSDCAFSVQKRCVLYTYSRSTDENKDITNEEIWGSSCIGLQVWQEREALLGVNAHGECFIWDVKQNKTISFLKLKESRAAVRGKERKLTCFSFSSVSLKLICGFDNGQTVVLSTMDTDWDGVFAGSCSPSFSLIGAFQCHSGAVKDILQVSSTSLFYGAISCGKDNKVVHWDTILGTMLGRYSYAHRQSTNHFPISGHKQVVQSTSRVFAVRVQVGMLTKQLLLTTVGDLVTVMEVYSPRSPFTSCPKPLKAPQLQLRSFYVLDGAVQSPRALQLSGQQLRVLDTQYGNTLANVDCLESLQQEKAEALCQAWAPELGMHVVAGSDGNLYLYSTRTLQIVCTSVQPAAVEKLCPWLQKKSRFSDVLAFPSEGTHAYARVKHCQHKLNQDTGYAPMNPEYGEVNKYRGLDREHSDVPVFSLESSATEKKFNPFRRYANQSSWEDGQREVEVQRHSKHSAYHIVTGAMNGELRLWKCTTANTMHFKQVSDLKLASLRYIGKIGSHSGSIVRILYVEPKFVESELPANTQLPERECIVSISEDGIVKCWEPRRSKFLGFLRVQSNTPQANAGPSLDPHVQQNNCHAEAGSYKEPNGELESCTKSNNQYTGLPDIADPTSNPSKVTCAVIPRDSGTILIGFDNGAIQSHPIPVPKLSALEDPVYNSKSSARDSLLANSPLCSVHQHARTITDLQTAHGPCQDVFTDSILVLSSSLDQNVIIWKCGGSKGQFGSIESIHCLCFEYPVLSASFAGFDFSVVFATCETVVFKVWDWKCRVRRDYVASDDNLALETLEAESPSVEETTSPPERNLSSLSTYGVGSGLYDELSSVMSSSSVEDAYKLKVRITDQVTKTPRHGLVHVSTPVLGSTTFEKFQNTERESPFMQYSDWQDHVVVDSPDDTADMLMSLFEEECQVIVDGLERTSFESQPLISISSAVRVVEKMVNVNRKQYNHGPSNGAERAKSSWLEDFIKARSQSSKKVCFSELLCVVNDLRRRRHSDNRRLRQLELRKPSALPKYHRMGLKKGKVRYNEMGERVTSNVMVDAPEKPLTNSESKEVIFWKDKEYASEYNQFATNGYQEARLSRGSSRMNKRLFTIVRTLPKRFQKIYKREALAETRRRRTSSSVGMSINKKSVEEESVSIPKLGVCHSQDLIKTSAVLEIVRAICNEYWINQQWCQASPNTPEQNLENFMVNWHARHFGNRSVALQRVLTLLNSICASIEHPICRLMVHLLGLGMDPPLEKEYVQLFSLFFQMASELPSWHRPNDPRGAVIRTDDVSAQLFHLISGFAMTALLPVQTKAQLVLTISNALASISFKCEHDDIQEDCVHLEKAVEQVLAEWRKWKASSTSNEPEENKTLCVVPAGPPLPRVKSKRPINTNQFNIQSTFAHQNQGAYERIISGDSKVNIGNEVPEAEQTLLLSSTNVPLRQARCESMSSNSKHLLVNKHRRAKPSKRKLDDSISSKRRIFKKNTNLAKVKKLMRSGHDAVHHITTLPLEELGDDPAELKWFNREKDIVVNPIAPESTSGDQYRMHNPFEDHFEKVIGETGNQNNPSRGSSRNIHPSFEGSSTFLSTPIALPNMKVPQNEGKNGDNHFHYSLRESIQNWGSDNEQDTNISVLSKRKQYLDDPNGAIELLQNYEETIDTAQENPEESVPGSQGKLPNVSDQLQTRSLASTPQGDLADGSVFSQELQGITPESSTAQSTMLDGPSLNESTTSSVAEGRRLEFTWGYELAVQTASSDPNSSTLSGIPTKLLMDSIAKPPGAMVGTTAKQTERKKPATAPGSRLMVRPKRVQDLSSDGRRRTAHERGGAMGVAYRPTGMEIRPMQHADSDTTPQEGLISQEPVKEDNGETAPQPRQGTPNVILTDFDRAFVCVTPADGAAPSKPILNPKRTRRHSAPALCVPTWDVPAPRRASLAVDARRSSVGDMMGVTRALKQVLHRNSSTVNVHRKSSLGTTRRTSISHSKRSSQKNPTPSSSEKGSLSTTATPREAPKEDEGKTVHTVPRAQQARELESTSAIENDTVPEEKKETEVPPVDQNVEKEEEEVQVEVPTVSTEPAVEKEDLQKDEGIAVAENELEPPELPPAPVEVVESKHSAEEEKQEEDIENEKYEEGDVVASLPREKTPDTMEKSAEWLQNQPRSVSVDETHTITELSISLKRDSQMSQFDDAASDGTSIQGAEGDTQAPEPSSTDGNGGDGEEVGIDASETDTAAPTETDTEGPTQEKSSAKTRIQKKGKKGKKKGTKGKKTKGSTKKSTKFRGMAQRGKPKKTKAQLQAEIDREAAELKERANKVLRTLFSPNKEKEDLEKKRRQEELLEQQRKELLEKRRQEKATAELMAVLMEQSDMVEDPGTSWVVEGNSKPASLGLLQRQQSRLDSTRSFKITKPATPPVELPSFKGLCSLKDNTAQTFHNKYTENIKVLPFELMKQTTSVPHWEPHEADTAESEMGTSPTGENSEDGEGVPSIALDDLAFLYQTNDFYTDEWMEWPPLEVAGHFPWQKYFDEAKIPEPKKVVETEPELDIEARILAETKKALHLPDANELSFDKRNSVPISPTRRRTTRKHSSAANAVARAINGQLAGLAEVKEEEGSVKEDASKTCESGTSNVATNSPQPWDKLRAAVFFSSRWRADRKERMKRNRSAKEIELLSRYGPDEEGVEDKTDFTGFVCDAVAPNQYNYYRVKVMDVGGILTIDLKTDKPVDLFLGTKLLPNVTDYTLKGYKVGKKHDQRIALLPGNQHYKKGWMYLGVFAVTPAEFELRVSSQIHSHTSQKLVNVATLTSKFQGIVSSKIVSRNKVMKVIADVKPSQEQEKKVENTEADVLPAAFGEMVSISSDYAEMLPSAEVIEGHNSEVSGLEHEIELVEQQLAHLERKRTRILTYELQGLRDELESVASEDDSDNIDAQGAVDVRRTRDDDDSSCTSGSDSDEISSLSDWETESLPLPEPDRWDENPQAMKILATPQGVSYEVGALDTSAAHPDNMEQKAVFDFRNLKMFENHVRECRKIFNQAASSNSSLPSSSLPVDQLPQVLRCVSLPILPKSIRNWIKMNRGRIEEGGNKGLDFEGFLEVLHELTNCQRVASRLRERLSVEEAKRIADLEAARRRSGQHLRKKPRPMFPPHFTDRVSRAHSGRSRRPRREKSAGRVGNLLNFRADPGWNVSRDEHRMRRFSPNNEVLEDKNAFKVVLPHQVSIAVGPKVENCEVANLSSPTRARMRRPDFNARFKKSKKELENARVLASRRAKRHQARSSKKKRLEARLGS